MIKRGFSFHLDGLEYHNYADSIQVLNETYTSFLKPLLLYAERLCRDRDAARDYVHESIVSIVENVYAAHKTASLYKIEKSKSYFYTSVRNNFLKSLGKLTKSIDESEPENDSSLQDKVEWKQNLEILAECVDMLNSRDQFIIEMHWEGHSYRDIAEMTTPPSTEIAIRKAASRAIAKIKKCVSENI